MAVILENIFKGFIQWTFGLSEEIVQYIANSLLDVFSMDFDYFCQVAPITNDILSIVIAAGWALLLGNLVFQALKSMASGLGFEGEDPKLLFTRTFVFAFLLLASRQICEIGLGISSSVINLLQIPDSVTITFPEETNFSLGASWLLTAIVGFVIMWQFIRFFFEIAERYVVTACLVLLAPLAFAMGGSKNTADIFKGWCRMFGSMCLMMVLNVVFLKLLISAKGYMATGIGVIPWTLLIVGIARVARKADSIVARIGLNPAITGDGLGHTLPSMIAYSIVRSFASSLGRSATHSTSGYAFHGGSGGGSGQGYTPPPPPPPSGGSGVFQGGTTSFAGAGGTGGESFLGAGAATGQHDGTTLSGTQNPSAEKMSAQQQGGISGSAPSHPRRAEQGTRRTAVPPEARSSSRPSLRFAAASVLSGAAQQAGRQAPVGNPQRPPISRARKATQSTQASSLHASSSSFFSASSNTASREFSGRKPLQQPGTPKIPTPPGVAMSGRGEPAASSSGTPFRPGSTPHAADGAGTKRVSRPMQTDGAASAAVGTAGSSIVPPPVPTADHVSAPAGTAGTRRPSASRPPSGGSAAPSHGTAGSRPSISPASSPRSISSPGGTAGTGNPSAPIHPVDTTPAFPGTAGTRTPSGPIHPVNISPGFSGTAGKQQSAEHTRSIGRIGSFPSGTAGTMKASAPSQPGGRAAPPVGTAGTASPHPARPPINQGTRRLKPGAVHPPQISPAQKPKPSRQKGGHNDHGT